MAVTDIFYKGKDRDWVRGIFGKKDVRYDASRVLQAGLGLNSAYVGDTTIGGNAAINPLPQFTKFADIKTYGYLARPNLNELTHESELNLGAFKMKSYTTGSYGMGRWYKENVENNRTRIYLQFGRQRFTGALTFYMNCHSLDMSYLARDGLWSGFMRTVGAAGALWASIAIFGGAVVLPIMGLLTIIKVLGAMAPSQYYYVDPAMDLYLRSVQSMLDNQLVHSRLVPYRSMLSGEEGKDITNPDEDGNAQIKEMHQGLPEIWKSNGKFDVFKMINRFQVLADFQDKQIEKYYNAANGDPVAYNRAIQSFINSARELDKVKEFTDMNVRDSKGKPISILDAITISKAQDPAFAVDIEKINDAKSLASSTQDLMTGARNKSDAPTPADKHVEQINKTSAELAAEKTVSDVWKNESSWYDSIAATFMSELHDGGQFVCFNVDGTGSVSDSISNQTITPAITSTINGMSSTARKINFATANMTTGIGAVDAVTNSIKDLVTGSLGALQLDGLANLFGTSQIIMGETWEDSSTDIGKETYTIPLRSWAGNDIAIFQNITVPLCFILAGCLPIATGKQTYLNPFFCKLISPGRAISRCAMITNVSITRGVGNLKWRSDGKMLACDVTITVKDLMPQVATPLIKHPGLFDSDNAYTDYMATLGNANMNDLVYKMAKAKLNFNMWKQSWKSTFSEGNIINSAANTGISRFASNFVHGASRFQ